ncbi:MAG: two-component system response regulator [Verrucomicrobia bacterium]|nr:MAG: two-component system response regulator [Verrucomicrobiota bacterium]
MSEQAVFLLVEDDENDIVLIRRSFIKANVLNPVYVVRSGEEAIEYLSGDGKYANRHEYPLPGLILLDLRLGKMDGLDVLRWVRKQTGLSNLRVVILTASDDMRDVNAAYQAGANSFLIKPLDFERFVEVSQAISGYWLWLDKAPDSSRPASARSTQPGEVRKHREPVRRYGWS